VAQATNNFEGGTNGNTIATSDTGSGNAWDAVTLPAGTGTLTYDTAHTYGALAGKLVCGTTSTTAYLQWSTATLGSITGDAYGRFYVYMTSNPFNINAQCLFRNNGTNRCRLSINTAGKIEVRDKSGVVQATSTNSLALNQWNRVEFHVTFATSTGFMEVKLFQNADSTTATETLTSASNLDFGGTTNNEFLIGWVSSQTSRTQWLENIVWGAASYPGPFATSTTSTLTASGVATPLGGIKSVGKVLTN
jgi:hypothetical protein